MIMIIFNTWDSQEDKIELDFNYSDSWALKACAFFPEIEMNAENSMIPTKPPGVSLNPEWMELTVTISSNQNNL